ncbi:hypothetical protein [Streptomyces caelestis]|uniref:hypothetical protein n=1 Tax=Streptomyces caelestis TaxID=36816 RepID=UPI00365BA994
MYAVKVVLLFPSAPASPGPPGPPADVPGDRRLEAIARYTRLAPQPGIAHVSLVRWGTRLVGMTFVDAPGPGEALVRARGGWNRWLSLPGLLPGWVVDTCEADLYLRGHRPLRPPAHDWHDDAMSP